VLQIASSLHDWGGIERYVVFLADGLRQAGHEVVVAAPKGSPIEARTVVAPISVRRKFDLPAISRYVRLLRQERPNIVHAHFSPDFVSPAIAARLVGGSLRVISRHVALRWSRRKARLYGRLWEGIIPVSHAVERALLDSGIPSERMIVAKAGVPALTPTVDRDAARAKLGIAPNAKAFGTFGRLVKEKGTEVFVQAVRQHPDVHGFVFGEGPERSKLESLVHEAPNVRIMGKVSNVADPMSAMDGVVIPSQWEEAFPYSALEAMSLGVPVIASRSGGMPEVVEPGTNGLLFERTSVEELAAILDNCTIDELQRLGRAGRAIHGEEYTVERMAERMAAAYRQFSSRRRESVGR